MWLGIIMDSKKKRKGGAKHKTEQQLSFDFKSHAGELLLPLDDKYTLRVWGDATLVHEEILSGQKIVCLLTSGSKATAVLKQSNRLALSLGLKLLTKKQQKKLEKWCKLQ